MDFFSPSTNLQTQQSFAEQLQSSLPETSPISMDFFNTSQTFTFPVESGQAQSGVSAMTVDQFFVGGNHGEEMGMDTDDPILHSLQTLAEGRDFGENTGEPQNFDVWSWFDNQ